MEVVLEDNGLKEFIDSNVPKPTSVDAALLDKKNSVGSCEGPYCVKPSWEIHSIFNVEGFDRYFPKQR